jgi:two-component system sensor histidine kinase CpxA
MPRLFWKLFLTLWLSIMAFAVLTTWFSEQIIRQRLPENAEESFKRDMQGLQKRLAQALKTGGDVPIRRVLRQVPRSAREHVFILDDNGNEIFGRDQTVQRLRRQPQRYKKEKVVDNTGREWILIIRNWRPPWTLLSPGPKGMTFRLALSALVSAIVSLFLARNLAAPLERLRSASRKIASGDMAVRVGPPLDKRRDEFGQLARDFDHMATRLQKMQSANQRLLRDVSHELRSPLARLRVALEIARNRQPGEVKNELDRIELESERLEALVGEVLELLRENSEAVPLDAEQFDLAELLQDLVEVVRYEIPEGAPGISMDVEAPLAIRGNRELLWRAVENLLRNALIHGPNAEVSLTARRHDNACINISVCDTGPGVPEAALEHLFDPFYRVEESRDRHSGGHGLGLAIAEAAVRRHRGEITARNRPGRGLEIQISIPPDLVAG